ncbi:MAG: hypothetical protein ACLFQY_01415 [Desulfococcaceae bacterium]
MRPFLLLLIFLFWVCLFPGKFVSASDFLLKRELLEQSLENGDIDMYDVPFTTYVSLGMWKEIDAILEANNRNVVKYALPQGHYSRPLTVNGEIWVFSEIETEKESVGIHVFDSDSLKLKRILRNERISRFRGGVRAAFGNRILLSGSGRNMETAALWNVRTENWRTLAVSEGNMISGVAVDDSSLYLGACGSIVDAWRLNSNFGSMKTYRANSSMSRAAGSESSPAECILGISVLKDRVIGVGESHVFHWNIGSGALEAVQPKTIKNSAVYIKDHHLVEFRGQRFIVRDLEFTPNATKEGTTGLPILDVGITKDRILAKQTGDILVVALAHHQGFVFYELDGLKRLAHVQMKSGPFSIQDGRLFVIRDQAIFQYDFRSMAPEAYGRFLKTIQLDSIPLTEGVYFQLLKRARIYSDVIPLNLLSRRFLMDQRISIRHSIAKNPGLVEGDRGKGIRREMVNTEESRNSGEVPRYYIDFELINRSEKAISLTLMIQWGNSNLDIPTSADNSASGVTWHHLNLAAYGGKGYGRVPVLGVEPKEVYLYPTKIEQGREQ